MATAKLTLYERYRADSRREPAATVLASSGGELAYRIRKLARETGGRLWLVADENTVAAAPEVVDEIDPAFGTIFAGSPPLVPLIEHAETIIAEARDADAAAIVVAGGGTLTDLAKYAAHEVSLPLVSVPTAASVDAYTSAKSALRIKGYHRTPWARVPDIVLACPEIVSTAPDLLGYAGIGDLIAKLVSRVDWQISSRLTGEEYSERESAWSAQVARTALARFRRAGLEASAITALDALLVTGRTMVLAGSSRPAASSEHTFAHLWEVALPGEPGLHGALVASATRIVLRAYRWIVSRLERGVGMPEDIKSRAGAVLRDEESWEERVPDAMTPYLDKMREESAGRNLSREALAQRLERIVTDRRDIARTTTVLLDEIDRALDALEERGGSDAFPEIAVVWQSRALEWVRYLRNRYSLFDLAWELGWEPDLLTHLG